ncbi:MAG TPA: PIN domain-containing protein [Blastocatellia bacterium]|nr:PIN domain-containing protein [Blastocatellia bacterium]
MIFVDTGAWFASVVPSDADHASASQWLDQNTQPLLTTDYVIDETLTLLRARGESTRAIALGEQFFRGALAKVYFVTEEDIRETWELFRKFSDKDWSFTDCSSKVVMEKLGITHAFCFDHDFVQFGSIVVVP